MTALAGITFIITGLMLIICTGIMCGVYARLTAKINELYKTIDRLKAELKHITDII